MNLEQTKFVSIGFGSIVNASKISAVVSPESAPVKRLISEARQKGVLIDATYGRKTRSVIIMESGQVVLSLITADTVAQRLNQKSGEMEE